MVDELKTKVLELLDKELTANNVKVIGSNEIEKIKPAVGEGKFGKVYKGKYKDTDVAIKKMMFETLDENSVKEVIGEIKNLLVAATESIHVPAFYGVWQNGKKEAKHYHLVFEFIEGQQLRVVMTSLSFEDKLWVLYQTCEIINLLHKKKLIHRDIKPDNIMLNTKTKNVKLIDFGTAKIASKTVTFTSKAVGTTFYMAPDYFDIDVNDETDKPISNSDKVDVWSIGCMISEMLSGVYPWFNVTKSENKVEAFLIKKTQFPIPPIIAEKFPEFKEIIEKCTKPKSEERCRCEDVMDFLLPRIKKD